MPASKQDVLELVKTHQFAVLQLSEKSNALFSFQDKALY